MRSFNFTRAASARAGMALVLSFGGRALAQDVTPEPERVSVLPSPPVGPSDGSPQAGRYGEYCYLRDANDQFRLYVGGRAHIDAYLPFGPGVSSSSAGTGLEPTVFIRRACPELSGEFLGHWQWTIAGE